MSITLTLNDDIDISRGDTLVKIDKSARIFTLDTGRLFPETYQLIDKTNMTYGINLEVFFPNYEAVQQMVKEEGINLFYNSIESRHRCCQVRKLEPLKRAMQGLDVWICGLRKQQSVTRKDMQVVEWDDIHNLIKVNPLINWSEEDVEQYVNLITSCRTRDISAARYSSRTSLRHLWRMGYPAHRALGFKACCSPFRRVLFGIYGSGGRHRIGVEFRRQVHHESFLEE